MAWLPANHADYCKPSYVEDTHNLSGDCHGLVDNKNIRTESKETCIIIIIIINFEINKSITNQSTFNNVNMKRSCTSTSYMTARDFEMIASGFFDTEVDNQRTRSPKYLQ